MGKGNRTRTQRAAEVVFASGAQTKVNTEARTKTITGVVIALVALLLAGCIFLSLATSNGLFNRAKVAAKTEHYKVTGTMLSYYFMSNYQYMYYQIYSTYGSSLASYLLPATGSSLKDQTPAFGDGDQTWYEYLMEMTTDSITQYLTLCEEADKAGITLDDDDEQEIDDAIDSLAEYASENGYLTTASYIAASYGSGVTVSDIRKAMEISTLASKYQQTVSDELEAAITDDDINTEVEDNKADYYSATSYQYAISATLVAADAEATDDEEAAYETEKTEMKAKAEEIAKATTEEAFKKAVGEYLLTTFDALFDSSWSEESTDLTEIPTDSELEGYKAQVKTYITDVIDGKEATAPDFTGVAAKDALDAVVSAVYSSIITSGVESVETDTSWSDPTEDDATDMNKWLFDEDRKAGDTTVISSEGDSSSVYTAVLMIETSHKDTSATKDVAHILISASTAGYDDDDTDEENAASEKAKAKAEEILAQYLAGETTLEAFKALGEENTEDSSVVYEGVYEGQMVEAFEDWTFDESRQVGDTGIIETTYGWHIMYYIGDGDELWKENAKSAVLSEKLSDWYDAKSTEYGLTFNETVLDSLDF